MQNSVTRDGEHIVIRIHEDDAHGLRVALQPCCCAAAKSIRTQQVRDGMVDGLSKALARAETRRFDGARGGS